MLHRKGVPHAELGSHGYLPVWRYVEKKANGKTTFYTLPVSAYERNPDAAPGLPLSAQNAMLKFTEGVRKRLNGNREFSVNDTKPYKF